MRVALLLLLFVCLFVLSFSFNYLFLYKFDDFFSFIAQMELDKN